MNGDLTRDSFDPRDGYTAVRAQQGRVMLDADHNEQADILLGDTRMGRRDLVGAAAAPADAPGFGVTLAAGVPQLGAGRYLLNGLRLENAAALSLAGPQPFLPASVLPATAGEWLAYLEAWERSLTAVEEPSIREVALGGPDTTTRDQLVWQVRWLRLGNAGGGSTCAAAATALQNLGLLQDGTLEPRLDSSAISGPCIVSEAARFRGLENQLFRVEIHRGNLDGNGAPVAVTPTFKWSRDNGAVVAGVVSLVSTVPIRLSIDRLGPGGAAGFERGCSLEVRDESAVLASTPGVLARVSDVEGDTLVLALLDGATVAQLQAVLGGRRVIVRRWDSVGAASVGPGFVDIENGLQVRFGGGRYRSGDFWLLPARTALLPGTPSPIDWPMAGTGYLALPARGPLRRRSALGILDRDAAGTWTVRRDCRAQFAPLSSLVTLLAAGGDGQHAPSNSWLPAPLTVVVSRGRLPVAGASLRFTIDAGGGGLALAQPSTNPAAAATVDATTDAGGRAQVHWRLGPGPQARTAGTAWEPGIAQRVSVVVIGPAGVPDGPMIGFVALVADGLNLHIAGGNGQAGRPGERLEIALRARIDDGQRPVSDAVVEFSVLNRILQGNPLNQATGGSVLASARFVSGDTWTNGTLHHTVRTTTDADGVAQVQWTLGTELSLSTQRVEARLLDSAGQPTAQRALYLAQLAIAQETAWLPNVPWLAAAVGNGPQVQAAIDELARRLDQVARATTAFDPFVGLQWRGTDNLDRALGAASNVPLSQFAALSFRGDLVPTGRDLTVLSHHGGIRIYADMPEASGGASVVARLTGNVRRAGTRWEWTLSSEARGALNRLVTTAQPTRVVPVRVTVVPRWLPGGVAGDSDAVHEAMFMLVVGAVPYNMYGLRIAIGGGLL